MSHTVVKFPSKFEISRHVIAFLKKELENTGEGSFYTIALSGGSTPKELYSQMALEIPKLLRQKACLLQVDERMVPPEDKDSNQKMIRETLILPVKIPEDRFLSINTEQEHEEARDDYAAVLLKSPFIQKKGGTPVIDCLLLGMGSDGHTASLFSKEDCELEGIAAATRPAHLPYRRISLTYKTLIMARKALFLVTGKSKALKLKEIGDGGDFPAARVLKAASDAVLYADLSAVSLLKK